LVLTGGNLKFAQDVLLDASQAGKINSLDITDSAENISNNFATISDSKVLTARLTAGSSTLSLSEDYANSSTLAKVKGTFDINVSNATLGQTTAMQADSKVTSYSLAATSSAIGTTLPAVLDLSKLDQINITQDATAMSVSLANYVLVEDKLNKLAGNFGLNVTEVKVSDLDTLSDKNAVSSIQISDTSEHISENWDQLVSLGDKLKSIQNTNAEVPVAITFDQYGTSATTIAKFSTTQSLALIEVTPDQATSAAGETNVATVSVVGLADQVATNFESLVALGTKLDSIEISDSNALELTQAQYDSDTGEATLNKINGPHELVILE
jgi:hypothetical protein